MYSKVTAALLPCLALASTAFAQTAMLRPAPRVDLPPVIDGNSAAFWANGTMNLFHSTGVPSISRGQDQFLLYSTEGVAFDSAAHSPVWFEAAWQDDDGTLYLWYHHEPGGVCSGNSLTAPKIGAAISYDGGATVQDLGIVLESPYPPNCGAKNGFFAGGHGDASVILDRNRSYFYFLFTNYGGPVEEQGVSVARMKFQDRKKPVGAVWKMYEGDWTERGIGGKVTPIFPATRAWEREDAESFWGPSIHWNTYLQQYVVLLNRTCCKPGWPQEGIYISYSADISDPSAWHLPQKLLDRSQLRWLPGYYPQVLGLNEGETDSVAGGVARFYIHGRSEWEIVFVPDQPWFGDPLPDDPPPDNSGSDPHLGLP